MSNSKSSSNRFWLYGRHTVLAALANPERKKHRLVTTSANYPQVSRTVKPEILEHHELDQLLPPGSVHQGIALLTSPIPNPKLDHVLEKTTSQSVIVVLDQTNDPRNIGAVLRSAVAFRADAVIVQDRNNPKATATLAKAASGALDLMSLIKVTNLARTLNQLKEVGYWCTGLDRNATQTLAEIKLSGKTALVFGAEGRGLRRLVKEECDNLARIPVDKSMASLNVSVAVAVALYELKRI